MNFEIIGVWPANKGALLMLEAVKARILQDYPKARFAAPVGWPAEARLANGMWATPSRSGGRPNLTSLFERAPGRLHNAVGFIPGRKIDVLLDASGFGYGDFWGLPKLRDRLTQRLAAWKTGNKKAILLPQALGPFEKPGMADAFRAAVDRLDLVFVRDAKSQSYVEAVVPGRKHIHRAPDFTNLLHPELPARLNDLRGQSVVIPNEKMVTGKPKEVRANYLAFLKQAVQAIQASSRPVFILVHEGAMDRALADELNASLDKPVQIVDEPSALTTKAVISVADLTISSRFHGLVSGLSSGVPSLACGWSHKYLELLSDYGCPDFAVDIDRPETWEAKLRDFLSASTDQGFRNRLRQRADEERAKSEKMWSTVMAAIR